MRGVRKWFFQAAIATSITFPVHAQTTRKAPLSQPTAGQVGTAATAGPATVSTTDQAQSGPRQANPAEILITARRVTERAQDVPLPVSVLSQDQLAVGRTPTVESLSGAVPNVKVFKTVGNADAYAIYVRGLGRDNNYFNVEAPVALYVDDVIYPYQVGPVVNVGDISRVEVLRGPQGTLYGRNATVGAVKYYTITPDPDHFDLTASFTGGSYGRAEATGGINVPLADNLAFRVSAAYHGYDGFYRDLRTGRDLGGTDDVGGRFSLHWKPTAHLTISGSLDGLQDRDEPQPITSYIVASPTLAYPRFGDPLNVQTIATDPQLNKLDVLGGNIQVALAYDHVTIKSITSYRWSHQLFDVDPIGRASVTFAGSIADTRSKTFTQELQATGDFFDKRLTYVAGLFYLKSPTHFQAETPYAAGDPLYFTYQDAVTRAAYVNATLKVVGALSVSAGVRTGRDSKFDVQNLTKTTAGSFRSSGSAHWNSTSPRFSVDYKFNRNFLAYASYSKGYEAGALSSVQPTLAALASVYVPPQTINDKEVGVKTQWFDGDLTLNTDYFWSKYLNQTTAVLTPALLPLLVATDQRAHGLEVEFRARPVHNWTIVGNIATLNGKYIDIDPSNASSSNLADKTPKHNPKFTFNVSTDYVLRRIFTQTDSFDVGASIYHTSSTFECINHNIVCVSPAYTLLDVHGAYTLPDERTEIIVSGTNVTNHKYFKVSVTGLGNFFAPPAEISVTFRYKLR